MSRAGQRRRSARERAELVSALMTPPCRDCQAGPGAGCNWHITTEASRIDRSPALVIHTARAADAVAAELVTVKDLAAQYAPGTAPETITSLSATP